jgi:phosphate:Na+ symporter
MYDIIGSAVFGTLIYLFPAILNWFTATWAEPARQVAMFHTLYNVATMFLLLPFVTYIAFLMERLVPGKGDDLNAMYEKKLLYLDSPLNISPAVILTNAKAEIVRMGNITKENHQLSVLTFFDNHMNHKDKIRENRKIIVFLKKGIKQKLIETNSYGVSPQEALRIVEMLGIVNDIEKIDDQAKKIAGCMKAMEDVGLAFSGTTLNELKMLSGIVEEILNESLLAYEKEDTKKLSMIKSQLKIARSLKATCIESRTERLKAESYNLNKNKIFDDLVKSFERSAERAKDIAFSITTD